MVHSEAFEMDDEEERQRRGRWRLLLGEGSDVGPNRARDWIGHGAGVAVGATAANLHQPAANGGL
jgi:hypothetical protein